MEMRSVFIFLFLFFGNFISAQNLVVNPDFEDCGTPWKDSRVTRPLLGLDVPGWTDPSGTSDYYYFSTRKERKKLGDIYPKQDSGIAYTGFILTQNGAEEYIEGTLQEPLVKGKMYRFSVSIYDTTISNLIPLVGIYFSYRQQNKLEDFAQPISLTPQIKLDTTKKTEGQHGWHTYYQDYTADGDENYFIIGGFKQKSSSADPKDFIYGYCNIDDVSLVLQDEKVAVADSEKIEIQNVIEIPIDTLEIAAGKTLVASNIYFETDKSILKNESFPILDEIISAMNDQPNLKVEIDGHTDSNGSASHNQKLSEDRAKAVADYFMKNGIDKNRISTKGFGSSKPISDDNDKNRRVEFIFSN